MPNQNINPFEEKSPVGQMQVSTATGLPQFKADVDIEYDATTKVISVTPNGLGANEATVYSLIVTGPQGAKKRLNVNLGSPAAVTADLAAAGFDLTKELRWTFIANNEGATQTLQFSRTISATTDYSQNFSN